MKKRKIRNDDDGCHDDDDDERGRDDAYHPRRAFGSRAMTVDGRDSFAVKMDEAHFSHIRDDGFHGGDAADILKRCRTSENEPYDEDDPLTAHVRFAPTSGATVDEVYAAMSEGSMLNPDPRADGDDDDDGDFFASVAAAADGLGASARDETSERLDKVLVVEDEVGDLMRRDPSRFED